MAFPLRNPNNDDALSDFIRQSLGERLRFNAEAVDKLFKKILKSTLITWEDLELDKIALALVSRPIIQKELDKLFERAMTDENIHFSQAEQIHRQTIAQADQLFANYEFEITLYAHQAYLLLLLMPQAEWLAKEMQRLAIKGWKRIANFVKNSSEVILWQYCRKMNPETAETEEEVHTFQIILFFTCLFQKPYYAEDPGAELGRLRDSLYYDNSFVALYKEFKNTSPAPSGYLKALDILIEDVFPTGLPTQIKDLALSSDDYKKPYQLKRDGTELNKLLISLSSTMQMPLADLPISKQDIREVMELYLGRIKYEQTNKLKEAVGLVCKEPDEMDDIAVIHQIVTYGLYIKVLLREYQKTKTYALKHSVQMHQYTFQSQNQAQAEHYLELQWQHETDAKMIKNLQEQNKQLKEALEQSEREKLKLENNLETLKEEADTYREEALHYRSIWDQDEEALEESEQDLSYEEKVAAINQMAGLMFGGTKKWQARMTQLLPDWQFISREHIHFDENLVRNASIVVVNIMNISHTLYYKIRNTSIAYGRELDYLNMNTNIEITINQLYQIINKSY